MENNTPQPRIFCNLNKMYFYYENLQSILKILEITPENRLVLQLLDAIMNLALICVLRSLGSQ